MKAHAVREDNAPAAAATATPSTAPPSPPHATPDVGEIGSLASQWHWALRTFVSLACNMGSFLLFVLLTSGVPASAVGNNVLAGFMLGLWLAANALRRLSPFLWTEPGKLTYTRVCAVTSLRIPPTLRGYAAFWTVAADIALLPLTLAFAAFHRVFVFSIFGFFLYPPLSGSAVPLVLFFILFTVLGLAAAVTAYLVVLPQDRTDPYQYEAGRPLSSLPKVAVLAAVALAVPVLTWSCAAVPCAEPRHLAFSDGVRCQGPGHHTLTVFAMGFLFLSGCLAEAAVGYLCILRDVSSTPLHKEPRNDAFFLELQMSLRTLVVLVATLSTHGAEYVIVALASGTLLFYVWTGKSRYVPSSVGVLKDLYVLLLILTTVSSSTIFVLSCVGLKNWMGCIIWLVVWLLSLGGSGYLFVANNGIDLFAPASTTDGALEVL